MNKVGYQIALGEKKKKNQTKTMKKTSALQIYSLQ